MADPFPAAAPQAVTWLGYGGLVPFAGLATALVAGVHPELARTALVAYGAAILSFVGALHWGVAMLLPMPARASTHLFIWSTVPALVAWIALMLPAHWAGTLLIAGFLAHYRQDRRLAMRAALPAWYLPLRLQLSVVASLCLLTLTRY